MLQIKNALGGGKPEGLYVWKKYYYEPEITVTNPQFTMSGGSYVYSIYSITNANFDLTLLPSMGGYSENSSSTPSELTRVSGQVADFFDGFKYDSSTYFYLSETSLNLSAGSKANTMYNFNAIDSSNGWIAGQYTGTGCGSVNNTFKYTGTKVIKPEIKDFIGYIVSDKETAYPDGGEKGGYWYEKVVDGVDLTSLGFTKWEIGEFTLASSSYNPTIKHSLGVVPKAILIRASSFPTSANRIHMYAALQADGGDYNAVFNYLNEYGPTYAAGGPPSFYSDKIVCTAQSSYKFINATPYKYIILY